MWLAAQRLDAPSPFGDGPDATAAAVRHLGYVQIDTINVIERCHHHILWSRIPGYRREHLVAAQSQARSVAEAWTHALSYVPSEDWRFFMPAMRARRQAPPTWFGSVTPTELRRTIARIRDNGPLTIRDVADDVLVEKDHPWASRKPTKRALQLGFLTGVLTISARAGMLKTYELTERHFGWDRPPRAATEAQVNDYMLDRALRAQGLVSLDSVCHLEAGRKPAMRVSVERRVARRGLVPVTVEGVGKVEHWAEPAVLATTQPPLDPDAVHLLSPFDPLVIQRRRLALLFGYAHRFEAYVPRDKRVMGYFTLPVLAGDAVVAALDLKTDRAAGRLLIQRWSWVGAGDPILHKAAIEAALHRFERFQLQPPEAQRDASADPSALDGAEG